MLYLAFAVLTAFLATTSAHNIQMKAHSRECFHEQLHKDDKMTVTFQVGDREFGGSGNLELDFWIQKPDNSYQVHERAVSAGDHSFEAPIDGRYTYCFSNEHWSANTKEVSFNVHGIVYVPESEAPQDPLEKEVRQLSELVAQVKDEQGYIIIRERTHRNTAESTNARVKWWSIFQLLVLLGEGIFQVWWLKRFFEVPVGPWPSHPKLKELGRYERAQMKGSLEAHSVALYTQVLNYSLDQVKVILGVVKKELNDPSLQWYTFYRVVYVYGKSPKV
ncbi:hypothetical protein W97_00273 [Coniosporium apollinis CBS 100218]|uniref:GOLD domain-containing protein n=1 Tax=Coniosporium apollinis (strain CBS 100218) TaxID=1168221 RepID=R7YGP1_CONA1|nr:uncharacterized protein W97_00273 [Coniosporium apollinis CBS 100218]EON61062.1 hypothetical protein W97_00273 [Coniosporium apollinis CBS 100218]